VYEVLWFLNVTKIGTKSEHHSFNSTQRQNNYIYVFIIYM